MALPVAWTEATLIAAVEDELESVSADLGLLDLNVLSTAVTQDVPTLLGVSSVAAVTYTDVTVVIKVLAAAKWMGWQKAYDVAMLQSDMKAGDVDLKDSQIFDHISARLATAQADYYTAVAAEASAAGTSSTWAFALVHGCRGR